MHELRPPVRSAAALWAPLARFIDGEARLGAWAARRSDTAFIYEFLRFGVKQGWACLFGGAMVALIVGTHLWYPPAAALARYDFMFLMALAIQAAMLGFKLETWEEAKVILIYHIVGTIMEIFKTDVGSWIYPEANFFRIGGVPLFSGFMYASIGSYIARCWRLFDFRFGRHPPMWSLYALAVAIYVNFYAHHYTFDMRYVLFVAAAILFGRTWIDYKIWRTHRRMPLLLGLFLVALFVWIAENIGTITKTWLYPHQMAGWSAVSFGKLGSWSLLLMISYALVVAINRPAPMNAQTIIE
ncbi:MAG TPA: DUF817 domain-containing protein [Xanthobacteraceae bacterium]|nr:DUF817 domain-containing protein [Xanthobacteraceae bacterium]